MPTSAYMGREFFTRHLDRVKDELDVIVDFGPGEGTYSILGRHIAPHADWTAIEIFEPYIKRYDLMEKYNDVIVCDLLHYYPRPYSLGIFGDVLEHLPEDDVRKVLDRHAQRALFLYVSVPIIPAPQGPSHGNEHEAHLHDWTFDDMTDLIASLGSEQWDAWRGHTVGRWWVDL